MSIKPQLLKTSKGFTLIELLIVIAVLGVLAAVVLVAIDPVEQLARGRDAGRKTSNAQVGHAAEAYYTANGSYPAIGAAAGQWGATPQPLVASGDLKLFPKDPGGSVVAPACTGGTLYNGTCYKVNATPDFVIYSHLESKTEQRKGTCAGVVANTWFVFSSADGRSGTVCQVAEPAAGGSFTYY